ncbi:hypothetical protein PUNSTDRAFT_138444 [Punctularia strigosozonata HHB-11173 SS5]|uniref:Uncharacterized protein n=1 Tax=Punctularia strigosozonata (strain HHB-11173) TaxID=741275 RepID=R7S3F8_PUNST|nr:uncharacterized protein PUNSTDRAFT_138444 [Punctularia strigosozonata HHB-11173 SS5]EIN04404.1 hypothetical protein PUNSTDRAFT_138444 [Punctularia strigosozonata HHB-11173 SS5]
MSAPAVAWPPPSHDPRRRFQLTNREQALRLHLDSYRPAQTQLARGGFGTMPMPIQRRTAPDSEWAPLYASFGEIPYTTLHRRRNWCAYCEQKAMRTLPRWVAHARELGYEGGKMVFVNYYPDALIEWDDGERRWRYMVSHHHRSLDFF